MNTLRPSYFHHCANCHVLHVKPLPYVQWLKLANRLETA